MTLKSTFSSRTRKLRRNRPIRDLVTGGVTALIGIGLLAETANAVSKVGK